MRSVASVARLAVAVETGMIILVSQVGADGVPAAVVFTSATLVRVIALTAFGGT